MPEAFREMQDEDFTSTILEDAPAAPAKPTVVERDADDDVLDSTQDIRRAILLNLADGKGGILNDKDSMAIAIATVRDMDNQALKKKGLRIKSDSNKAVGDVAKNLEAMQRAIIERGMNIVTAAPPSRSASALDPRALPKPTTTIDGEFQEQGAQESSEEFFKRMESK